MKDNWKDAYYDENGRDLSQLGTDKCRYFSPLGSKPVGNVHGDRLYPFNLKNIGINQSRDYIFAGGRYSVQGATLSTYQGYGFQIIGQGMDVTSIDWNYQRGGGGEKISFIDQTITKLKFNLDAKGTTFFLRCRLLKDAVPYPEHSSYCIIYNSSLNGNANYSRNSYIQINHTKDHKDLARKQSLFHDSTIEITQEVINDFKKYYHAFDDCTFKIGAWTGKLSGSTEEEYRGLFVKKCTDANIAITEDDVKNWVFANNASSDGKVFKDSIIANFANKKTIKLGAFDYYVEPIHIVAKGAAKVNSIGSVDGLNMTSDGKALHLKSDFPFTQKGVGHISSNVISFKGVKQLAAIDILDNLPHNTGLSVTSEHATQGEAIPVKITGTAGEAKLVIGERYIVRAPSEGEGANKFASFKYNNVIYSTSIFDSNNVILAATENAVFTDVIGNPILYAAPNTELLQTYEMRIVDEIPGAPQKNGNLKKGYWYVVEPDKTTDLSGTVKVGNVTHNCYGSFFVEDVTAFTVSGACHVRECFGEETFDETFYKNKQKPLWFSVLGNDMRGLRKGNSIYEDEMQLDENSKYMGSGHPDFYSTLKVLSDKEKEKYIASGHPDFYTMINGQNGIKYPAFPIKGKYFQLRVKVSSFNIM